MPWLKTHIKSWKVLRNTFRAALIPTLSLLAPMNSQGDLLGFLWPWISRFIPSLFHFTPWVFTSSEEFAFVVWIPCFKSKGKSSLEIYRRMYEKVFFPDEIQRDLWDTFIILTSWKAEKEKKQQQQRQCGHRDQSLASSLNSLPWWANSGSVSNSFAAQRLRFIPPSWVLSWEEKIKTVWLKRVTFWSWSFWCHRCCFSSPNH